MIEQMQLPFQRIEVAVNGEEALERLRKERFDLVIADIRMPVLDGLSLMEQVRAEAIDTLFLIVSGYDDFSYAQRALENGARAYLLKPVAPSELQMRLEQILVTIREQEKIRLNSERLALHARDSRRRALQLHARSGVRTDELAEIAAESPALWAAYRLYRLIPGRYAKGLSQAESFQSTQYILTALEEVLPPEDYYLIENTPHLLVAVSERPVPVDLIRKLQSRTIFAGSCVSRPGRAIESLPELYRETDLLYRYTYLFPEKDILMSKDLEDLQSDWTMPLQEIRDLFHLLGYEATYPLTDALSRLFQKSRLRQYSIDYFEDLAKTVVQMLEEYERVILPWVGKDRLDLASLRNPYAFPNIRTYLEELQKQLLHLNSHYAERQFSYQNSEHLRDAITFIQQNYYRDIDLATVADHVKLNYAYFSSVFKKNIGTSFSEYLRDVRIDSSKRLLLETTEKIAEIARLVGFDSYRSFVRSFQEVTGMQASEYRKLHHETPREVKYDRESI